METNDTHQVDDVNDLLARSFNTFIKSGKETLGSYYGKLSCLYSVIDHKLVARIRI